MPITAFSRILGKELDADQLLRALASRDGIDAEPMALGTVPDAWRAEIRADIECPSCFVVGAELVSASVSRTGGGRVVRQSCFRFPSHLPYCDFAQSGSDAGTTAENLVHFGSDKSKLTAAIRQLVGAGIQTGTFSQRSIRDMRQWFFVRKVGSSFVLTLDPSLPLWLSDLLRTTGGLFSSQPYVALTRELASLPGFDWRNSAIQELRARYRHIIDPIAAARLPVWQFAERAAVLARRHAGETVLDLSPLRNEYDKTIALSRFITRNYAPVQRYTKSRSGGEYEASILAFAALLLFISSWDLDEAASKFGSIASVADAASGEMGNVIGLNPWHDFEAWSGIRALQGMNIRAPTGVASAAGELAEIEMELRQKFAS